MSVSKQLIAYLEQRGVGHIFGVSGAKIERFFHEVHIAPEQIGVVITKHEAVAVAAADSSAKCGADFGAVAVTSGGAAFNIIPGLAEAYSKNTPLFIIVGQPTNNVMHHGAFQESSGENGTPSLLHVLQGVSRWCKSLESSSLLPQFLNEIDTVLLGERSGPAVLVVPENVFEEAAVSVVAPYVRHNPFSSTLHLEKLKSDELLFIVGSEVQKQKAFDSVDRMITTIGAPVITVSDGKTSVNNNAPEYAGLIGAMGHQSAFAQVAAKKQIVIVGARMREIDRLTLDLSQKELFFIGKERPFLGDCRIIGDDINYCCEQLCTVVEPLTFPEEIEVTTKAYDNENLYIATVDALNKSMNEPVNILVDAGNGGAYAMHYLLPPKGSHLNIALTMGGMGYSFGAAIGAALYNKRRTYQVAGDGSFFMHGFEVETALRMQLPITYIIFDNSGHQMCVTREELFFNEQSGNNSFMKSSLGKGFAHLFEGLHAFDIYSVDQLHARMRQQEQADGPVLFVIHVEDDVIPPFIPFERAAQ